MQGMMFCADGFALVPFDLLIYGSAPRHHFMMFMPCAFHNFLLENFLLLLSIVLVCELLITLKQVSQNICPTCDISKLEIKKTNTDTQF